jgi:hypothetical protein
MRSLPVARLAFQASATAVVLALACGCPAGGGENGDDVLTEACLDFAADAEPGAAQTKVVAMRKGSGSSCGKLAIEVVAKDVLNLHTVSFSVTFDPALVEFDRVSTSGSVLASDGARLLGGPSEGTGEVAVDLARESAVGVNASGTQHLLTLFFDRRGTSGTADASFSQLELLNPGPPGGAPAPIAGVTSIDGTLLIR